MLQEKPEVPHTPLSRREFLKGGLAAFLGLAVVPKVERAGKILTKLFPSTDESNKEIAPWQENRFFENIDSCDEKMLDIIRAELLAFSSEFGPLIDGRLGEYSDPSRVKECAESVETCLEILARMQTLYKQISSADGRELLQKDFYELGSKLWVILRIKEKFQNNPQELIAVFKKNYFGRKTNYTDPFIGEDLLTLKSQWANFWPQTPLETEGPNSSTQIGSPIFYLLVNPIQIDNFWWSEIKEAEKLPEYKADPTLENRPSPVEIILENKDEKVAKLIMEFLTQFQLDRAAAALTTHASKDILPRSYYYSGDRGIHYLTEDVAPDSDTMMMYPHGWQSLLLHEFGHAFHSLLPHLKSDKKVFGYRLKLENIYREFNPYSPLQKIFNPPGIPASEFESLRGSNLTSYINETRRLNTYDALTNYPAQKYVNYLYFSLRVYAEELARLSSQDSESQNPWFFRLIPKSKTKGKQFESIEDYLSFIKDNIGSEMNFFEKMVFDEIEKSKSLFDKKERYFGYGKENIEEYFETIVLPAAIAEVFIKKSAEINDEIINHVPIKDRPLVQHLLWSMKNEITLIKNYSNNELFAELFQATLRRKMEGMIADDSISEDQWQELETLFQYMTNDLIQEGLANNQADLIKPSQS